MFMTMLVILENFVLIAHTNQKGLKFSTIFIMLSIGCISVGTRVKSVKNLYIGLGSELITLNKNKV